MTNQHQNNKTKKQSFENDPDQILKRVEQGSETVGRSSAQKVAEDLTKHFSGADADQEKWSEVWGTRIGRILGALFFIFLVVYLFQTYVLIG